MSSDYTISVFKPTDYKDTYGNYWCEVAFEGESEPARWSMKPESVEKYKPGVSVYGHIEEATSKAGKPYNRFKTDQRPEGTQAPQSGSKPQTSSWDNPERQDAISRSVALNNTATIYQGVGDKANVVEMLALADQFYAWLTKTSIDEDIANVNISDSLDGIDY